MGGKSDAPPPPDYTPIAMASAQSAQLSYKIAKDQLDWAKKTYADNKDVTDRVINSFLSAQDQNQANAEKDRARYEKIYQPLENQLADEAQSYASPERRDLEMGRAQAGVAQQFDSARNAAVQQLESYGIDPSSTRYAALDIGTRAQEAAAKAAAGNQASQMVDATGRALRSEAINVGRGYPGQIAGTYNTALAAGQGAGNQTLAQTASGANTMGTGAQWQGMGNNALGVWGNTLNMGYQNAMSAYNADNQSSGLGSALGLAGAIATKFIAEGGPVGDDQTPGGAIPAEASPSRGGAIDDVPARLTVDEFVIPRDVARWKGEEYFQKLIEQSRKAKDSAVAKPEVAAAPQQAPTFASRPGGALPLR